jgi:hypothetical protein
MFPYYKCKSFFKEYEKADTALHSARYYVHLDRRRRTDASREPDFRRFCEGHLIAAKNLRLPNSAKSPSLDLKSSDIFANNSFIR